MMKYLLVAGVLFVAWHLWRAGRTACAPPPAARKPLPRPEGMVQCARCGVHLPQSDAIAWRGRHYCSQAHLPLQA